MQFISRDPALSDAEESAYQYCGGEPVGKTDPSGLYAHSFVPDRGQQTTYFLKVLKVNAGWTLYRKGMIAQWPFLAWFKRVVSPGQPWDFKLCAPRSLRDVPLFRFRGRKISMEDFGNIHFGFVGHAAGFSLLQLQIGSWWADMEGTHGGSGLNEAYDERCIAWGYMMYDDEGYRLKPGWLVNRYVYPGHSTLRL
jgi:hypothetical protein